jgi:c(7)-type cytochrome triheme protein
LRRGIGVGVAVLGLSVAAEPLILANFKAAPYVPPVEPMPQSVPDEELHPARQSIERNPIHDLRNPEHGTLQRIDEATRNLPKDIIGFPDWMASLRAGLISPREGLKPGDKMNVLDLDVVMRNTKEMPFVKFPHLAHTLWLDCSNCHPTPFIPKAGENAINMGHIFRGQFCGMCHDRVAFITFFSCDRCHSVPQAAAAIKK